MQGRTALALAAPPVQASGSGQAAAWAELLSLEGSDPACGPQPTEHARTQGPAAQRERDMRVRQHTSPPHGPQRIRPTHVDVSPVRTRPRQAHASIKPRMHTRAGCPSPPALSQRAEHLRAGVCRAGPRRAPSTSWLPAADRAAAAWRGACARAAAGEPSRPQRRGRRGGGVVCARRWPVRRSSGSTPARIGRAAGWGVPSGRSEHDRGGARPGRSSRSRPALCCPREQHATDESVTHRSRHGGTDVHLQTQPQKKASRMETQVKTVTEALIPG